MANTTQSKTGKAVPVRDLSSDNDAAYREDTAEMMSKLAEHLTDALLLARRLDVRGVDLVKLGVGVSRIKALRDAAEDAYTLRRV